MKTIKKKMIKIFSVAIGITILFMQSVYADVSLQEHVIWNRAPINVVLPLNKERMVTFPGIMQFGYDQSALPPDTLRVQNNNGTAYLTAYRTFTSQRIQVRMIKDGRIVLLNLSAQADADNTPLNVVFGDDELQGKTKNNNKILRNVNPISLMRFAEQQLYAKKRLLTIPANIFVTPMHTSKTVPLLLDGRIVSMPLRSWRSGSYFVTAVELHNLSNDVISLNLTRLCGNWCMAGFFPQTVLASKGCLRDSTTAILVSTDSFSDSINVCTGQEV